METRTPQTCLLSLPVIPALLACGCDCTDTIEIPSPSNGQHFTGTAPYAMGVNMLIWVSGCMSSPFGETKGTVYVDGVEAGTWQVQALSMPKYVDVTVSLPSHGEHTVEAVSDKGNAYAAVTVHLDPWPSRSIGRTIPPPRRTGSVPETPPWFVCIEARAFPLSKSSRLKRSVVVLS
jgi:hypothetical protein